MLSKICRYAICLLLPIPFLLFDSVISINFVRAGDNPFAYPANQGYTGIMEVPTARIMKESTYRFGAAQVDPYRYYYIALSPYERLEISGTITEVLGVRADNGNERFRGYGNTKDKSIGVKFRFLDESKWLPAMAVSIIDPHGTRLYGSQSIVASKQIYPLDFTVGIGNGRFGKSSIGSSGEGFRIEMLSDPKSWARDARVFWGIQCDLSDKYALMFEYNPIKYNRQTRDPAQSKYFDKSPPSPYNIGFRWKPLPWTEVDVSYQRGNRLGVNLSMLFDIGQPLIPIYDAPYEEKSSNKTKPAQERLSEALHNSGFSDIGIMDNGNDLLIQLQNEKYYYHTKAVAVVALLVREIISQDRNVRIVFTQDGVPLFQFSTTRYDITEWYAGRLSGSELFFLADVDTDIHDAPLTNLKHKSSFGYTIKPSIQTFLNDPSGFFKYRLGAEGLVRFRPLNGLSLIAGVEGYALNNISTVNEPLQDPIRTDLPLYKKRSVSLNRLMFNQIQKTGSNTYGQLSGGFLETQYAGFDAEVGRSFGDGRVMLSLSSSIVKKREPGTVFGLKDGLHGKTYHTWFLNTRLNIPELDTVLDLKTGRFLGGDKGARITVSKNFRGVVLYGWYSATDTSVFRDPLNRGYHDKGVGIQIPLRLFDGSDSRTVYNYTLSPWTRDVAQDIDHYSTIFDFIGRAAKIFLDKDKTLLYNQK